MTTEQRDIVADALASALVCLAGDPTFSAEEQKLREALRIMGVTVVNSAGEPV